MLNTLFPNNNSLRSHYFNIVEMRTQHEATHSPKY